MELREGRPSYVRFELRPEEDREATLRAGHYVTRDVEYAVLTPAGSKDEIPRKVVDWMKQLKQYEKEGRMPPELVGKYIAAYEAWKRGEDIPLSGTPIKTWPVLSPAERSNVIAANIRTVEDLAGANGEAKHRMGMMAEQLVQKAQQWLKAANDVGKVVQENTRLRVENAELKANVDRLAKKVDELAAKIPQAA